MSGLADEPELDREPGRAACSDHVAIGRIALYGGQSREVITVRRAFLIAAIEDARSWCHEVETPRGPGRTSGNLADYDAALAVLEHGRAVPDETPEEP